MLTPRKQLSIQAKHSGSLLLVSPLAISDLVSVLDFSGIAPRSVVRRECFPRNHSHKEVL